MILHVCLSDYNLITLVLLLLFPIAHSHLFITVSPCLPPSRVRPMLIPDALAIDSYGRVRKNNSYRCPMFFIGHLSVFDFLITSEFDFFFQSVVALVLKVLNFVFDVRFLFFSNSTHFLNESFVVPISCFMSLTDEMLCWIAGI